MQIWLGGVEWTLAKLNKTLIIKTFQTLIFKLELYSVIITFHIKDN
jgi:hypothetical protein